MNSEPKEAEEKKKGCYCIRGDGARYRVIGES